MSLLNLSAAELARIDAVCLRFEAELRSGQGARIEAMLAANPDVDAVVLREELEAIQAELAAGETSAPHAPAGNDESRNSKEPGESIFRPGVHLGPYKIDSLIGRGGMGRVYRGFDTRLARPVAIKVLADDWAQRQDRVERFERESRAVAAMRHSNIVSLFDIGNHAGRPYAVMELLEGETLRERMNRGPMSHRETRLVGAQAADALAAAHARGIVHRDLKPENLFLTANDASDSSLAQTTTVKLLDFGLSRSPDGDVAGSSEPTASGIVMGTAGYMAPEQARGEKATFAADIFSLGCVLHECFYGRSPFPGKTLAESLGAVLHTDPVVDPETLATDPDLAALIDLCLRKAPPQRPATASDVARGLRSAVGASGDTALSDAALPAADQTWHPIASPTESTTGRQATTSRQVTTTEIPSLDRRSVLKWVAVTTTGLVGGAGLWSATMSGTSRMDSIAVLPLNAADESHRLPVGSREMSDDEQIAAMLVNQLAQQRDLKVVPYRPLASSPADYKEIGRELGVNGLVLVDVTGEDEQRQIHLQLVDVSGSAASGQLVWGDTFAYGSQASLLEQRSHAAVLADKIGIQVHALRETGETEIPQAFSCLINGQARLDPDSEAGLREAMNCFGNARRVDEQFAEAHAGFSIAALSLAALESTDASKKLVREAREGVLRAMELQPRSSLANLAAAMLKWRNDRQYQEAEQHFQTALEAMPNSWQVQHEFALFAAARQDAPTALAAANRAVTLNALSLTLRIDATRLRWFTGSHELARIEAGAVLQDFPNSIKARGLVIDLAEQFQDYAAAAALQGLAWQPADGLDAYFVARMTRLTEFPYGPFGPKANEAIAAARQDRIDDIYLSSLIQAQPTMLVFLLAAHPVFAELRTRPIAQEILPIAVNAAAKA